jgi:hypothetical protein
MRQIIDGVYELVMTTEEWSERDVALMVRFGEPEVDLGGVFDSAVSDTLDPFTMPTDLVKVKSQSPFKQTFDSDDYGDETQEMAEVWEEVVQQRIVSAVSGLRDLLDDWTGEEVVNV